MTKKPYDYALDLLSARAYTTQALRRKLRQKTFEPAEIESVLSRLLESGLLNDEKYAAEFARQRLVTGGSSVRRVQQVLA
jgi:regulatory protein